MKRKHNDKTTTVVLSTNKKLKPAGKNNPSVKLKVL